VSADLCPFYLLFRPLISELAERNSTIPGGMFRRKCNLKRMSKIWGIPSPYKSGAQKPPVRRLCNLTANLTAYIFWKKHDRQSGLSVLGTRIGLLHRLIKTWTLVHKQLQTGPAFLSTIRKFCIPLHCLASHTEVSKRNSTKLCQTAHSKLC